MRILIFSSCALVTVAANHSSARAVWPFLMLASSSRSAYFLWALALSTLEVDERMVSKITLLVFSLTIWYITIYRSVDGLALFCSTPSTENYHPISDGLS